MRITFIFICIFAVLSATAQLLPSTAKKPVPAKPAAKSAAKPAAKPAASSQSGSKPVAESQKENVQPSVQKPAAKVVYDDQEVILFATLDELKNYKDAGKVARWSPERKILLYNLFRDKQLSVLTELNNEVKTLLNNNAAVPGTYKTVNDSWNKLFSDQNWIKYTNMEGINTLRESLKGLETQYQTFAEQYWKFVSRQQTLPDAKNLQEYHLKMFDREIGSSELESLNKMMQFSNTIGADLNALKDIGLLMERSLNELNLNLDKVARSKNRNFSPFTPLNKMTNGTVLSTPVVANPVLNNNTVQILNDNAPKATLLPEAKYTMIDLLRSTPQKKAAKQGDINTFKSFITGDINRVYEEFRGLTPLMYAMANEADLKLIRYLIESGADLNTTSSYAEWMINKSKEKVAISPLMVFSYAYSYKNDEYLAFIDFLIQKGARFYLSSAPVQRYAAANYMIAVLTGQLKKPVIGILKQKGIDLESDASLNFMR